MTKDILFTINNSGALTAYQVEFERICRTALKKVRAKLKCGRLDLVISEAMDSRGLKDLSGVGGFCPNGSFIEISLDVKNKDFAKDWRARLEETLVHEAHHASRAQTGIDIAHGTFHELIISEGLADYFVHETLGRRPLWLKDYDKTSPKNLSDLIHKASKDFTKPITDKLYDKWFLLGSPKQKIPRWAGYLIGFQLVKNYFKNNPRHTSASVINKPATEFANY